MKSFLVLGLFAVVPLATGCIAEVDDPESDDLETFYEEAELDLEIDDVAADTAEVWGPAEVDYRRAVGVPVVRAPGEAALPPHGDDARDALDELSKASSFTSGGEAPDEEGTFHGDSEDNPDPTPWHAYTDAENPDPTPWR